MRSPAVRVAFVCVQNAGRSQLATAFAEEERQRRSLEQDVDIVTGGTQPADRVHEVVVVLLDEVGIDLTDRAPRAITPDELQDTDVVITMGCSVSDVCPASWSGESRDWALEDPDGTDLEDGRAIRDEVRRRVREFFDELEQEVTPRV